MTKKIIVVILVNLCVLKVNAQDSLLSKEINLLLATGDGFRGASRESFFALPNEQQTLLFSILIDIDKVGNVESIKFTNKSPRQDSILIYEEMARFLKSDKRKVFKKYSGHFIIAPIWVRKLDGFKLEVTPAFIKSFDLLIPSKSSIPKGKIVHILPVIRYNLMDPVYD